MTDKQIIDGKECRYWFRPNPCDYRKCSLRSENDNCDEIKDCFVKELLGKLAQKDEECKRLKEEIKTNGFGCFNIEMSEQLDQLKVENDTLRQFLSKEPLALQALQSGYASYKKSSDVFYEMVKQYKQTLTEIKYIAEKHKATAHCDYLTDMDNILQKISECEVENER